MNRYSSSSSASSSYRQTQQSSRHPPSPVEHSIKCSDCGLNIHLLSMEEHICPGVGSSSEKRRKPEMRLETGLSLPRSTAYGMGLSAHGAYGSGAHQFLIV